VRSRSFATLSLVAVSALALAGCAGAADTETTPTGSPAADDLCAVAAPSGAQSDAVTVEGPEGSAPTAAFDAPLEIAEVQRTVVSEGDGDALEAGDLVSYALTALDATTGEELGSLGYAEGELLPQPITTDSVLAQFFGCAPVGSRVVTTLPANDANGSPAAVYVLDLLSVTPSTAWGEDQEVPDGLPTVELDDEGAPTITIPGADAPTDLQLATLKQGDGPVVEPGDTVLVQYRGVRWSDGEEFDSTWSRGGVPTSFPTTGVVDGFRQALEGQTVGSQVLAVIPPALGYGSAEGNELQNETLVFVIDILATQHPAEDAPQQ
jgi:hypothetical protein